jgi:hypothetical protein
MDPDDDRFADLVVEPLAVLKKNLAAGQNAEKLVMGRVQSRRLRSPRSVLCVTNQGIRIRGAKSRYGWKETHLGLEFYNFHSIYWDDHIYSM